MAPKISVVIPVYNSEKFLQECLNSVKSQSFTDWEVIAVDDGSSDGSSEILDEYAASDARFHVIHKANGGVSAARNDGLAAATGEYVLFVDSDDELCEGALQNYSDVAERSFADVVIADHYSFFDNGSEKRYKFFSQEFVTNDKTIIEKVQQTMLYGSYSPYYSASSGYLFGALWTKLFRRSLLVDNSIRFQTDISLFEDGLFGLNAFEYAQSIAYIQQPLYRYRIVKTSLCHSYAYNAIDLYKRISKNILGYLNNFQKNQAFYEAYETRFVYYAKKQVGQIFASKMNFFQKYRACRRLLNDEFYRPFLSKIPGMNLVKNDKLFAKLVSFKLYFFLSVLMQIRRG